MSALGDTPSIGTGTDTNTNTAGAGARAGGGAPLRVLVLGSGAREHALAWAAARSPRCAALFVLPGNGGTPGVRIPLAAGADPVAAALDVAVAERIDLVIVGPETLLAKGVADRLGAAGIAVFGPSRAAAELEWSKAAARRFCADAGIPSPAFSVFTDADAAVAWMDAQPFRVVVKADGLAAGKGVVVPESRDEAVAAIRSALGPPSPPGTVPAPATTTSDTATVVLEERLDGEEVSLLAFCDGERGVLMPGAQDHKRAYEGDRGPNTGGMGAYAPAPVASPELVAAVQAQVIDPALALCRAQGRPYRGVLYAGIMCTATGPKVIEFNSRFGDPEAQVLLPLLATDFLDVAEACARTSLAGVDITWHAGTAVGVVIAAAGYPAPPRRGDAISGIDGALGEPGVLVFHGGTTNTPDTARALVTDGGRVLTAVGLGDGVDDARGRAYRAVGRIRFDGSWHRRDIAWRAVARRTGGYAAAGVDIEAGTDAVARLKAAVESTHSPAVLAGVGAFGGAIDVSSLKQYDAPVLVASTDGVGTKVALALEHGRIRSTGLDIVNHCVNDVLVQRARPLFFLDYIATASLDPRIVGSVLDGMAEAARAAGCAILGGETAEMPGTYQPGHWDIAGTLVGVAERAHLLPRRDIVPGDVLIGMRSSGPHTNGYSLLRRIFAAVPLDATPHPLDRPLGDALLEPHRSYYGALAPLLGLASADGSPSPGVDPDAGAAVKALVHITGGGLLDNVPRALPDGCGADVILGSWPMPPLWQLVHDVAKLAEEEYYRTFNMGIGMVIVASADGAAAVKAAIGEPTWIIGRVTSTPGVALR